MAATRIINVTELYYFIRGRLMSNTPSHTPTTVSLADEEAVRRILVDTIFGLWATVNNLTRLRPSQHERYRVTVFGSAHRAGALGLRRGQADVLGPQRDELRHHHGWRPRFDAGG
jgi:hypothetical protein